MNINNIEKVENPSLSRVEITADITYDGATPKASDVRAGIAQKVSGKEELIVVKHIYSRFGERSARVLAYMYSDEALLKAIEPKTGKKPEEAKAEPEKKE